MSIINNEKLSSKCQKILSTEIREMHETSLCACFKIQKSSQLVLNPMMMELLTNEDSYIVRAIPQFIPK
ncbi:hypothetical protein ACH3XW_39265 [Acanthocheilonema viteae]